VEILKKTIEILSIIIASATMSSGFIGMGYRLYGQELVKNDITELNKPLNRKIEVVEKDVKGIETNIEKLIRKQDFTNDVLYQMNKRAYLRVKKERNDKE